MKIRELLHPFELYRKNKKKYCLTAIVIVIVINLMAYYYIYLFEPEDPKAEMEEKIYKGAYKEFNKLETTYKQQDPSFPESRFTKNDVDYDFEDKSAWISPEFDESLSSSIIAEFAEAIAKGAFGATTENELQEVEVFTVINGWPQPFFYDRDDF